MSTNVRKYKFAEEEDLYKVAIPDTTETYVAVSNELALTSVREGLQRIGMTPVREEYKLSKTGQVATGRLFIGDPDRGIQRCLGWINSYDKSKPFGIACGGNVVICTNGLFTSEIVTLRKHTKNVLDDLRIMIDKALRYLEISFNNAIQAKEYFEKVKLERSAINEIIGQLYLEEEIVSNYQLSIIRDGLKFNQDFNMRAEPSMWNLYNLITESFKRSHPSSYLGDHVDLHKYMIGKLHEWELPNIPEPYTLDVDFEPDSSPVPVLSESTSEVDTLETVAQNNIVEF